MHGGGERPHCTGSLSAVLVEALSYRDDGDNAVATEAAWFEIGSSVCRGLGETLVAEALTIVHAGGTADTGSSDDVQQAVHSIGADDLRIASQQLLASRTEKPRFVPEVSEAVIATEVCRQVVDWWQAGKEIFCVASATTVGKGCGQALQQTQDFEELGRELRPLAPSLLGLVNQQLYVAAGGTANALRADIRDGLSSEAACAVRGCGGKFAEDQEQLWQQCVDRSLSAASRAPVPALQMLQPVVARTVQAALPISWARRKLLEQLRPTLQEVTADCAQLEADIVGVHELMSELAEMHPQMRSFGKETGERAMPSAPFQGASAAAGPDEAAGTCRAPTANDDCNALSVRQGPRREPRSANSIAVQPAVGSGLQPKRMVVLNCANIGFQYSYLRSGNAASQGPCRFDWEGVRQAIRFYKRCGVVPQGICQHRIALYSPVPQDLQECVTVCPHVDDQSDADDLFTIRVAMRYSCQFVDNDNYRDWKHDPKRTDHDVREWLLHGDGAHLKVTYVFDTFGRFIPSAQPPSLYSYYRCARKTASDPALSAQ